MLPLLLVGVATAAPYTLVDAGQRVPRGAPMALVVVSPGLDPSALSGIVDALEGRGIDAWTVSFPPAAQDPGAIIETHLPAAIHELGGEAAVVGYGLGGTLAAAAALRGTIRPTALALLGAPLRVPDQLLGEELLARAPENGLLTPDALHGVSWRGAPALPLLLGDPTPTLAPLSAHWLVAVRGWIQTDPALDLAPLQCPIWAGAGALDNLAPPETIRGLIGEGTFVRFGYNRLDRHTFDHARLIADPAPAQSIAAWLSRGLQ